MSAAFRLEKKKASQQDLRRLMQEQRSSRNGESTKRIESAFAKYENNQLFCSLCNSLVKSEKVWQVHLNAKQHKDNLAKAKELKAKIESEQVKKSNPEDRVQSLKRSIQEMRSEVPEKKIKGILKNSSSTSTIVSSSNVAAQEPPKEEIKPTSGVPDDFFDTNKVKKQSNEPPVEKMQVDDPLPEGFFDDPVKDLIYFNLLSVFTLKLFQNLKKKFEISSSLLIYRQRKFKFKSKVFV